MAVFVLYREHYSVLATVTCRLVSMAKIETSRREEWEIRMTRGEILLHSRLKSEGICLGATEWSTIKFCWNRHRIGSCDSKSNPEVNK